METARYLSVITPWEILINRRLSALISPHDIEAGIAALELKAVKPVRVDHVWAMAGLPPLHTDPFDRMLIAQAFVFGLSVIITDRKFSEYPNLSVIQY